MPEFVVFAIAASMCVLCFAVGFIAALNLRIAERTALPLVGGLGRNDDSALPRPDAAQSSAATTPFVPTRAAPTPVSLPQAERTFEQQADVAPRPTTPLPLPRRTQAVQPVGFPAPASPAAKVFLFGEPHVDAVVGPTLPPAPAASQPNAWVTTQHGTPQPLAPAQVELLPQYARSARRR